MIDVHFSSKSNEWATPQDFFDRLNEEFHFTLDAAATPENAKCDRYFTLRQNGLIQDWTGETVWLNPPYARQIQRWIDKAKYAKATTVCLVPARTDTRWWAQFWDYKNHKPIENCEVRFIKGRLRFGNHETNAAFPSAVVIFRNNK